MPYAGDYYGDYYGDYAGDPGIFSSIGSAIGGVLKTAGSFLPGPLGGVAKAVGNIVAPVTPTAPARTVQTTAGPITLQPPPVSGPGMYSGEQVLAQAPPGTVLQGSGQAGTLISAAGAALACSPNGKRTHANKSTYVTRGGGTSHWPQQILVHPKGTTCVTTRRMNPANPRALRRAIRRGRGAVKLLRGAAGAMGYSVVSKASLAKRPKARRR